MVTFLTLNPLLPTLNLLLTLILTLTLGDLVPYTGEWLDTHPGP